jgi:PAS domain S-box-containing protein
MGGGVTVERGQKYLHIRIPLLLILAIGVLLYEVWIFAVYQRARNDQTGVFFGPQLVVEQTFLDSPLHNGDIILKIGGLDVNDNLLKPFRWLRQFAPDTKKGSEYTILRAGEEQSVFVAWNDYQALPLLWRGGALWLTGAVMSIMALVLITGKGHDLATRLISLGFIMGGLNQVNNLIRTASTNMALAWAWFFIPLDAISVWLTFSLLLHALLLFPEVKAPLRRFPWLPWAIHLMTPVVSLTAGFLFGGDTLLGQRNAMFAVANPLMLLQLILGVAAITHTYFTSRRPGVRNQIRWIILGLALALIPWTLFYALPSLLFNMTWLPLSVVNLSLLLIPISVMVSIFRFRLMDVDRVMNRTLVSALSGGALILLYFLVLLITRDTLPKVNGQPNYFLAGIIAATVLFIVFNPLRIYIQHAVNRAFFKEQLDVNQILREVGQQLSTAVMQDDVYTLLTHDISQQLGLTSAHILLPGKGACAYTDWENTVCISDDSPLIPWLREHRDPLVLHQRRGLPENVRAATEPLVAAGGEVCLSLMQRNNLLGIYLFGGKGSGNLFNREEVDSLVLLGQQAAAAIYNAQLYETLQEYNRSLEAHVEARTSELQAERNRLNTVLQNITDGLVVTDSKGKIALANAAFCDIVNMPSDHILGKPLATVFPSNTLTRLINIASAYPGQAQTETIVGDVIDSGVYDTYRIYKASACAMIPRTLSDVATRAGEPGNAGVVTVVQDITHEQEVDRMKTDFISMVSHELRTPLTSVLGFARLIQRIFDQELAPRIAATDQRGRWAVERVNDNLKIITNEGDRLTRLINDVLDIAKMEAGKIEWVMTDIPFQEIIDTAVSALRALSIQKNVPVLVEVQDLPPTVFVDRDRMVQVMTNLLVNALKFTNEGQITIRAQCVDGLSDHAPPVLQSLQVPEIDGAWLWVSVQDTGVGIPADKLPQVFEKFKQIRNSLSQQAHGTGLGLPICREIIGQHQGHIWVESKAGVGSTFSFVIPLQEQATSETGIDGHPTEMHLSS